MKHEYHEAPEAAERFEKMAITVFRASKSSAKPVAGIHQFVERNMPRLVERVDPSRKAYLGG